MNREPEPEFGFGNSIIPYPTIHIAYAAGALLGWLSIDFAIATGAIMLFGSVAGSVGVAWALNRNSR